MSWLGDIFDAIVGLTRRKPKPIRHNKAHSWQSGEFRGVGLNKRWHWHEPPVCLHCRATQTLMNEFAPCPGPPIEAQP